MFNIDKSINKIIGTKHRKKDTDMDGVPDWKDCQPKNVMRQDEIAIAGMQKIITGLEPEVVERKVKEYKEGYEGEW